MKSLRLAFTVLLTLFLGGFYSTAQIPIGYYTTATGLTGSAMKTALYNIIKNHTAVSYTPGVWNAYATTDIKSGSTIWDIYTDIPSGTPAYTFTFSTDQCGTYGKEGDCYNREHSFPKSWFADATPMYTDLFHLYPTDGKVNGMRGNLPYGEVGTATYTSSNGSKVGMCIYSGYSGEVFEPIDEYKGDLARSYFYMATRYENIIASWEANDINGDAVLDGTAFPVFETWFINMLLEWNAADPVSAKETSRNNAIYAIQGNRNPFIDHPEYAIAIWNPSAAVAAEPSNHATNFSSKFIRLNWVDAIGNNAPTGYLIKMSSSGFASISNPVDGVAESDDANTKNIAAGVQTCVFSGLTSSTTYYFKLFPYTGAGASINYKTDGSPQQLSKIVN